MISNPKDRKERQNLKGGEARYPYFKWQMNIYVTRRIRSKSAFVLVGFRFSATLPTAGSHTCDLSILSVALTISAPRPLGLLVLTGRI